MKNKAYVMACIFLCFMLYVVSFSYSIYRKQSEKTLSAAVFKLKSENDIPDEYDKLLSSEYGKSEYMCENENIRMDVEKVVKENYFIKYSWANYDLSNLCFYIFVSDVNGDALSKDDNISVSYCEADKTDVAAFYADIVDFPTDDPLGYKKIITARFLPLGGKCEVLSLKIIYNGNEYIISDIPINK